MDTEFTTTSPKILAFIEAYLERWNATEAARVAQYKNPTEMGYRLMKRPDVQAAISARLDQMAMPANEVLARITQHARVNMGDFMIFEDKTVIDEETGEVRIEKEYVGINWDMVRTHGYLIKKISYSRQGKPQIELVDSQHALDQLGKHRKLFAEQIEHSGTLEVDVNDARANIQRKLAGIAAASGSEPVSE